MALTDKLTSIADAIRSKTGKTDKLTLDAMVTEIDGIETGSGTKGDFTLEEIKDFVTGCSNNYGSDNVRKVASAVIATMTKIPDYAFYGKKGLSWSGNAVTNLSHITEIGESGFYYAYMDEYSTGMGVNLNFASLTHIKNKGFSNNKYGTISAPLLTTLDDDAMSYNYGCDTLSLPSATSVGSRCFASGDFKEVNLPLVTTLKQSEFSSCEYLEKVDLASLVDIQNPSYYSPFGYCNKLTALILRSNTLVKLADKDGLVGYITNTTMPLSPAYTGNNPGYIYVPKALIEEYRTATNWTVFADKFRAIEDYPDICEVSK